ncbi:hypothetical protein [Niveispirillum sp.]|uniref:hypothetical protein n=1 Tax=Niveispirillum sp. TaxID=1917217 RepID=UPI001B66EB7F|nr:hypothetical protein [Niveispirillum sp.]MBP7336905.1 hypothetical protein [Niveispirillum sp.]
MGDPAYQVRQIGRLLDIHDDGDTQARINESLQKALDDMQHRQANGEKAKASLVITVAMEAHSKGVSVSLGHELKLPKTPPAKTEFFVDDDNTLTTKNPRQREMFGGKGMASHGNTAAG